MENPYEHGKEIGSIQQCVKDLNTKIDSIAITLEDIKKLQQEHGKFIDRIKIYIGVGTLGFTIIWTLAKDYWYKLFNNN